MYDARFSRPLLYLTTAIACVICPGSAVDAQNHWPQFRGPESRGVGEGTALPIKWSATDNVEWKTDLPGRGWSSPIVWGDRIFVTTVVNLGESEAPKKGLYFGGNRPEPPKSQHQWKVYCLNLHDGSKIWEQLLLDAVPESSIHLKNSFASETPVTDGEHVYVYFGNVGVFCLDFDGNVVWMKELEPQTTRFGWGTAASPVLYEDRIYIVNDNDDSSYLMALDKSSGEELWRVDREEKSNWATPFVWSHSRRNEIITPGTDEIRSYDLDGHQLWSLRGMSSITIATPYAHDGLLYISSGYVRDKMKPIYAIRPGAEGDISLSEGETSNDWIAWSRTDIGPYNPSTLVYRNRLYVLYDLGLLACFNPVDGSTVYDRQRLGGKQFTSSPWAYGGYIFCLDENGVTFVIKEGDQFELLRTNELAEDDMCMATPAIAGDRLIIRTSERIYSIRDSASD